MSSKTEHNWARIARQTRGPDGENSQWACLERFLTDLSESDRPDKQVRLLLESVRDLTGAEAAVLVPAAADESVLISGPGPDAVSARRMVDRLLGAAGSSPYQAFDALALAAMLRGVVDPVPVGVALAQVGRSHLSWVMAVSYSPTRRLRPGSVGAVRLAARMLRARQRSARYEADLSETLFGVVQGFAAAIDAKDPCTYGHSERVARMAGRIGNQMGLPPGTVSDLYLAGLLHDIGKIGVPEAVLSKPGKLTEAEFAQVQTHPVIGDRILAGIRQLAHVRPGVRGHHERYDGGGYPDRLSGAAIPLLGRVLAVADTCDAMLSTRPYRPALAPAEVEAELMRGSGKQWDPAAVDGFLACRKEIYAIRQVGLGGSAFAAVNHAVRVAADFHDVSE